MMVARSFTKYLVMRSSVVRILFYLQIRMSFSMSRLMDFYTSRSSGSSKSRYMKWYASIEEMKIISKQKRTTFILGRFSKKETENLLVLCKTMICIALET